MSEQNKALVAHAYDSFDAGGVDQLLNLMSPDITWKLAEIESAPFGGVKQGLQSVAEFLVNVNNLQERLDYRRHDIIAEGNKVVVLGNYRWRVRSTKKVFACDFAHVWTIREGKLAEFQ